MADSDCLAKQFAADTLHAIQSGALPLRNAEQIITTLAEMVIALAQGNQELRELCQAKQEAADAGVWIIANANLIRA